MPAPTAISCPLNLEALVTQGFVDGLSTLEIGAIVRLLRSAWPEDPPCTLPGEDIVLAMVARLTDDEWTRVKPRVFAALAAAPADGGRIAFGHAARVHQELAARVAADTEQRRAAGRASAAARRGDPPPPPEPSGPNARSTGVGTGVQRSLNERSTGVGSRSAPALSLIPAPSALTLERSSIKTGIERSERSESAGDVIAAIRVDAREIVDQQLATWRRRKARTILEDAIGKWRSARMTNCPTSKAIELAALPAATPARVDYLVTCVADIVSAGKTCNPIALVIAGLGASERTRRRGPVEVPLYVTKRWHDAETDAVKALQAQASINARIASLSTNPASTDQAGVRPGGGRA